MPKLPKEITDFMTKWGVGEAEVWLVPGGKAYAVKHSTLERIAAQAGIVFGPPHIIEAHGDSKVYSLWMDARLGDRIEWSTGEAAPANNKNSYPLAMAEKRAKDRCTLKLLAIHGILYSEDEFKDERPPERQDDADAANVIPIATDVDRKSAYHIKSQRPNDWPEVVSKFRAAKTAAELKAVAGSKYVEDMTRDWPLGFLDELRSEYSTCLKALTHKVEAAE